MKKNWIFIFFSAFIILFEQANAQNPYQPNISGTNPVTPSAFQFVKYTEMPVSEYTGIPNISVPLYQINVDDIKLPVNLTYHAVGIQVSQEASWVGLGWDGRVARQGSRFGLVLPCCTKSWARLDWCRPGCMDPIAKKGTASGRRKLRE